MQVQERVSGTGVGGSIWCRYRKKYLVQGKEGYLEHPLGKSIWSIYR